MLICRRSGGCKNHLVAPKSNVGPIDERVPLDALCVTEAVQICSLVDDLVEGPKDEGITHSKEGVGHPGPGLTCSLSGPLPVPSCTAPRPHDSCVDTLGTIALLGTSHDEACGRR